MSRLALSALLGGVTVALSAGPAATWSFTDVTAAAGLGGWQHGYIDGRFGPTALTAGGVAAGDYDRDGWVDLYVVRGEIGPNLLFRNRGDGTFEEVGAAAGVALTGALGCGPTFADVDGDGWLDLLVLGVGIDRDTLTPPSLFRNRGDGTFEDVTARSGIVTTRDSVSAAFGDYDRDGDLDLFLAHWGDNRPLGSSEHLWQNDGHGTFIDVSDAAGFTAAYTNSEGTAIGDLSFTPNFVDIDSDGWLDLLIAGDFETSKVFRNARDGTFVETTDRTVITDQNGMGGAIGDYDNDGDLDWFVSSIYDPTGNPHGNNWFSSGNRLYRNRGDGTFDDVTEAAGVRDGYWGWGSTFADLDNDGFLDIFHVNGWAPLDPEAARYHRDPALCFVSNGDGTFSERAAELGVADPGQGRGVVAFDYDRDGDVDLFIANNQEPASLYRNDGGNAGHHLAVALRGRAPNSEGIGARVTLVAGGRTQMRELRAGNNFESQDPAEAHFGLGTADAVETVGVRWPDGSTTTLGRIAADRRLVIGEPALDLARARAGKRPGVAVRCEVPEGKGSCEAVGFAEGAVQVTGRLKRAIGRRGRVRLTLPLNARGRRLLRSAGTLAVRTKVTIVDGAGQATEHERSVSLARRRNGHGNGNG